MQKLGQVRLEELVGELKQRERALVEGVREQQGYSKHRVVLGRQGLPVARSQLVEPDEDPVR